MQVLQPKTCPWSFCFPYLVPASDPSPGDNPVMGSHRVFFLLRADQAPAKSSSHKKYRRKIISKEGLRATTKDLGS